MASNAQDMAESMVDVDAEMLRLLDDPVAEAERELLMLCNPFEDPKEDLRQLQLVAEKCKSLNTTAETARLSFQWTWSGRNNKN